MFKFERRFVTIAVLFAFLILATTACSSSEEIEPVVVATGSQAGDLVGLEPCVNELGNKVYGANCGAPVVPENQENPDTKLIAFPLRVSPQSHVPRS
jgi:hypothetical protein